MQLTLRQQEKPDFYFIEKINITIMLSNFARLKILRRKTNLCLIQRTISTGGFQWDIPEKFNFAQDVIDAYAKGGLISEDILTLVLEKVWEIPILNFLFLG